MKTRRCMMAAPTFLVVFMTLSFSWAQLPEAVQRFVESQEDLVLDTAKRLTELHARRIELVRDCECSRHNCANKFPHAECFSGLATHPKICGEIEETGQGRLIDFEQSVIYTPPFEDVRNLPPSVKENICITRHLDSLWRDAFSKKNETSWIYIGTRDGFHRRYPGSPSRREDRNGDPDMNGCQVYDTRIRPWFIAASTGPKDVVLVVDKSGSMNDIIDTKKRSKWDLIKDSVSSFMDTFTLADFVNVVTFSDTASPLWTETGLVRGRKKNLDKLRKRMKDEFPEGKTNFTAAFTTAFRLLAENCDDEPKNCSNCQKIILFLTDGKDTSREDGSSIRPSEMAALIDHLQQRLENATGSQASIFTFSLTDQADDSIPRQLACTNNGAWSFISPQEDDTLTALNSYFLYISAGRRFSSPVWLEPYEDAGGLGILTTVAVPFYARNTEGDSDVFLGVAGHDVQFSEFEDLSISQDDALGWLIDRSENCVGTSDTQCESQIYRNARDERSLCTDPYPARILPRSTGSLTSRTRCYEHRDHYYKRITEEVSWNSAVSRCEEDGGELVSIQNEDELTLVANLASLDGSWTAARGISVDFFSWLNPAAGNISKRSDFWGLGEPHFETSAEHCAAIDTRGVIGNLFARPCDVGLSFICKYSSNSSCEAGIAFTPDRGYFKIPPLSKCLVTDEVLDATRPVAESADLKEKDIVCKFGPSRSNEEILCCDVEQQKHTPNFDENGKNEETSTSESQGYPHTTLFFASCIAVLYALVVF